METVTKTRWVQRVILWAVCALVIGVYAFTARPGFLDVASRNGGADTPYNLLVQGFRDGQLSLKKAPPAGFLKLTNPYDPIANEHYRNVPYRLHDLSYYKGRLYIYFGPPPALLLFWPYVALTGHYLSQTTGVIVFCALGFLVSVGLLRAFWRRYFPAIGFGVVIACTLALGLANGVLLMMARSAVYEVAVSCGFFLTMLTLAVLWRAVHEPDKRGRWLALASLIYGLAVASRPNLLFGAVILLVPILLAWRERHPLGVLLLAATVPILCIGLGLMLYNCRRFDSPLEFGLRYQLAGNWATNPKLFNLDSAWTNFRVYFLEPADWNSHFPFAHVVDEMTFSNGHSSVETPFGILTNIPLVWLVLALPLAWRTPPLASRRTLIYFVAIVALGFGINALFLVFLDTASFRYSIDFLPALLVLAVFGVLGLECRLVNGLPLWRRVCRLGWCTILGFSVATNLLVSLDQSARTDAASAKSENEVGVALANMGRYQEAIGFYEQAVRCEPRFAEAHYNLGIAFEGMGQVPEAIQQYQEVLRLRPDLVEAQKSLTRLQNGR